jgi:SsrA-binding protein
MNDSVIATNRKARFNYTILESLEAGIALKGTEVKSMRTGQCSLNDSFARIDNGEIFLHNMHVSPYEFGNINNVDPLRPRKLLLHKRQIGKIAGDVSSKRLALVPLKAYFKNGLVKIELALAKGKRQYDKRDAIRKREMDRELKRRVR